MKYVNNNTPCERLCIGCTNQIDLEFGGKFWIGCNLQNPLQSSTPDWMSIDECEKRRNK